MNWEEDLLGQGFEAATLELHADDEGDVVATLIRYVRDEDPEAFELSSDPLKPFIVLAIHGWNDYFFHREFARTVGSLGGHFYAIDLRKYGRSWREGQSWGFTTDLSIYDEDIHAALDVIHDEHGYEVPLFLYGHSTGGLTASLWADRHPGLLAGLMLNSPWLELQGSTILRYVGQPILDTLAQFSPTTVLPVNDTGNYQRLLTGWLAEGEELDLDDPSISSDPFFNGGWEPDERYRHIPTFPIRAGWLSAVLKGHAHVAAGLNIECPILTLTSSKTIIAETWKPDMRGADIVLDVAQIWKRVHSLGPLTTLLKLENAIHDVLLSRSSVRERAYGQMERWLRAYR